MREREFIDWIRSQSDFDPAAVPIGPGDDMAAVGQGDGQVLVTTDQVLDGVHFVLAEHGPRAAGRKAMARNLSDVAAMAAVPVGAVAAVALPRGFAREDAEEIYRGLREPADAFDCPLVGGDVGTWDGPLAMTVTVLARPGAGGVIRRAGARAGDAICVTGSLGGAWRGRRHLSFTPRVREALALAAGWELHAMIDLSDGLATDLGHICDASGVGAELIAARVPIHPDARGAEDPLAAALNDGEDYELLFTLPWDEPLEKLLACPPFEAPVACIGRIVEPDGVWLTGQDGRVRRVEPGGWEHRT